MNQKKLRSRSLSLMVLAIVLPLGWFPVFTLNPATRAGEPFEEIDRNDFLVQFRQAAHELDSLYKNVRIEGTHVATRPLQQRSREQREGQEQRNTDVAVQDDCVGILVLRSDGRERLFLSPSDASGTGTAVVRSGDRRIRLMRKGSCRKLVR